ncbi:MAG: F0F1 ATP synthase subunit delta [Actinomycetes bacterium]
MISLGGNSRQSLASLRSALDEKLKGLSPDDCAAISNDLFRALTALNSSVGLRRAFTDPSRDAQSKAVLVNDLFDKSLSKSVLFLLLEAVSQRWSSSADIASAVEQLAIEAEATAANGRDALDRVQDELFIFGRILGENRELRQVLGDRMGSVAGKHELVDSLFSAKAETSTTRLLSQMVNGLAGRSIDSVLAVYQDGVAARRNRLIVLVTTSAALTAGQSEKLKQVMSAQAGQPVHLNFHIDPAVLGGVSIRFADEMVDGTISTRLAEAGRALAV